MPLVALDLSPLKSGHAGRGVGTYTRLLYRALQEQHGVNVTDLATATPSDIDLIHYPYFDLFFSSLPLFKAKPSLVTIHDVIPLLFPHAYPKGKRGWLALLKQRVALQGVKAIITDSEASKADICQYLRIPADKVHVVYLAANPLLTTQKPSKIAEVKKQYHLPASYILYVGDINYNKNLPQLIKALKFLPEQLHLVCVGRNFRPQPIPEWQAIETQIAMTNVAGRISFITELAPEHQDELAAIYSGALCYVQPSLAEGFGLPVLEAMQCGTPVVVANNSSLREIAGPPAVLVDHNAENLAQGVQSVLEWTQTQRQQRVKQALTWSQRFTWTKTAQETLKVYQQVLQAHKLRKSA